MLLVRILRVGTLALMAGALLVVLRRPDLMPAFRKTLVWLIPIWIAMLFLAQTLVQPDTAGRTPLRVWWDRLRGRSWTCDGCGRRYPLDVPLCGECARLRPESAWVCEVCETKNEPEAAACVTCTVPRPGADA